MTKGKALILARHLLGPQASVKFHVPDNGPVLCIVQPHNGAPDAHGDTWEAALKLAEPTQ